MKRIHMWAAGVGAGAIAVTAAISPAAFATGGGGKGHESEHGKSTQYQSQPAFAKVKKGKTWHESNVDPCKKYPFRRSPDLSVETSGGGKHGGPLTITGKVSVNGCNLSGFTVYLQDGVNKSTTTGSDGTFSFSNVAVTNKKHRPETLTVYTNGVADIGLYPAFTRVELVNSSRFEHGKQPQKHR